ncbi:MAG: M18 family aminopeptidase [Pseudomonadales bacterium]
MNQRDLNQGLLAFLGSAPTPFHAVKGMAEQLAAAGYVRLHEKDEWNLQSSGRYFVTRNDSSIIAFNYGQGEPLSSGVRMLGAHTDSPCLKVKPQPELNNLGFYQLGVEKYGGMLLNPWFDRDLSLAGRVTYVNGAAEVCNALVDFERPVATVPSLAIHLDRTANENRTVNVQTDMPILLALQEGETPEAFRALLKKQLQTLNKDVKEVLDYEIYCYDTQPPALIGLKDEFIASARLDNLLSCYVGLRALIDSDAKVPSLLICTDHEEVGSASVAGAQGTFLNSVLERFCSNRIQLGQLAAQSMMISVDNAHGIHPNFADRHDNNHGPMLNKGPVIKINASQRYASNSETSAVFRHLCQRLDIPVQSFVVRSDMACGSTIGPIAATETGVKTLDIGVPSFAMHSIRELAGAADPFHLYGALRAFCELQQLPESSCV